MRRAERSRQHVRATLLAVPGVLGVRMTAGAVNVYVRPGVELPERERTACLAEGLAVRVVELRPRTRG